MFSKENYQSIDLLPERKKSKFTSDIKKVVLESNNFEITFPVFEYLYMFVFRIIPPIESK